MREREKGTNTADRGRKTTDSVNKKKSMPTPTRQLPHISYDMVAMTMLQLLL